MFVGAIRDQFAIQPRTDDGDPMDGTNAGRQRQPTARPAAGIPGDRCHLDSAAKRHLRPGGLSEGHRQEPGRRTAVHGDGEYSNGGGDGGWRSPDTARIIDEEVKRLIDAAFAESERILDENWEKVVAISEALLEYETLQSDELDLLMLGEKITRTSVSGLLEKEAGTDESVETSQVEDNDSDDASASGDVVPTPA